MPCAASRDADSSILPDGVGNGRSAKLPIWYTGRAQPFATEQPSRRREQLRDGRNLL